MSDLNTKATGLGRYYGLDAVRAFALITGIVFHGLESFVSYIPPGVWAIKEHVHPIFIDAFFFVSHVFRMQAFFLVAGFFSRMLYVKLGAAAFIVHRVKRIAIPLILFWPLIYSTIMILWIWGINIKGVESDATFKRIPVLSTALNTLVSGDWLLAGFPWVHLWFLYALLWIYAISLATHGLLQKRLDTSGRFRGIVSRIFAAIISLPAGSLILALPAIPFMFMMKNSFGVDTPDHGLVPYLPSLAIYSYYFMLGWILHRNAPLVGMITKYRILNTVLGVIFIAITATMFLSIVLNPSLGSSLGRAYSWLASLYNVFYAFASMTAMFAFIGLMLHYFPGENKTIKFLAGASYWMYIIHLPVVVFFQILAQPLAVHWTLKVTLIILPSFAIILLSYQFLVRFTWVGKLLNGSK